MLSLPSGGAQGRALFSEPYVGIISVTSTSAIKNFFIFFLFPLGGCRHVKFLPPESSQYLEGHVFLNLTIPIKIPCEHRCVMESECVSVNIGPPLNGRVVCELSNSDHFKHPEDIKERPGWIYRGTEVHTVGRN